MYEHTEPSSCTKPVKCECYAHRYSHCRNCGRPVSRVKEQK